MEKIKDSKGAATLFVLISGLFFISFILSILMLASVKRQAQIQIGKHTQEIYNELNQDKISNVKNIVPIYTQEQLLKIGSGEEIAIEKENGRKYVFSQSAYYILNSDIDLEYNGIWDLSQYNIDEAGYSIKIKDTSKPETAYYYYMDKYDYPVTENGFKYENLILHFDGTNNTGNGHSNGATEWKDLSGNGNNGTLTNFSYNSSSGWHTDRLTFDGESSYIILDNNPIYTENENTEYTLNIVVDVKSVKTHALFCNRTVSGQGLAVFWKNSTNDISSFNGTVGWNTEYELPTNQKININVVKNSNEIALYVDGELVKISNDVGDKTSLHEGISTIGVSQVMNSTTGVVGSYSNYLNGEIYLINIYDKALTEQEIKNNYEAENNRTIDYSEKTKGWDFSKISNIVKEKERIAPIPAGYVASSVSGEDTIEGGLVIYQGEDAVTSANHSTAMLNRNQYVWIPVDDINDMVMCKQNGNTGTNGTTTVCNLELENGDLVCKTHGYTTATTLTDSNIDTTGLAGRIYDVIVTGPDASGVYQTSTDFSDTAKNAQKFVANSSSDDASRYREPDLVTTHDIDDVTTDGDTSNDYMALAGVSSANALKYQLNEKFIEMAKSVAKYGGFYISRYEAGYDTTKDMIITKKNQKPITPATSASDTVNYLAGNRWYGLYNKTLNNTEKSNSVNSHMIWGCQHDQVIRFIGNEAHIGHTYQTKSQMVTGYEGDEDILNNIYDLEGNNWEWTAQAGGTHGRVLKGGNSTSANSDNFYSAFRRTNVYPTNSVYYYTTRSTLYIN